MLQITEQIKQLTLEFVNNGGESIIGQFQIAEESNNYFRNVSIKMYQ